ncbi:MAG TPA: hypothetical protein VF875_00600 [Anaeromyxobacter sp.]
MLTKRAARTLAALAAATVATVAVAEDAKPIQDNSFLVEEAYNQEPGVIQHISLFTRDRDTGNWVFAFTEEWPAFGQTHQASVTVQGLRTSAGTENVTGFGDVMLNYRWQAVGSGDTAVAFAPRLSVLIPSGDSKRNLGLGGAGLQMNLPISTVLSEHFVAHSNLGGTWIPAARTADASGPSFGMNVGQSLIFLAHHNVNLMLEAAYSTMELDAPGGAQRVETFFVSPGVRGALDFSFGLQIVGGVAVPIGVGPSAGSLGILGYLSFEHPITKNAI